MDKKVQKMKVKSLNRYENIDEVRYYEVLPFVPKIIWTELIKCHYNDLLTGYFGINKIKKLIGQKYY